MSFPSDSEAIPVSLMQAECPGIGIWLSSLQAVQLQITFRTSDFHSKTLSIVQEQPQITLFSVINLLLSITIPVKKGIILSYVI